MNIDERLDRLTERHEALTQSVELTHRDIQALTTDFREFVSKHEDFEKRMIQYSADVKDAINRLANIAAVHEERLDDHQQRIEKLES